MVLHARKLQHTKEELQKLRERDADDAKPKTVATRQELQKLEDGKRYMVMNRRTGQMASLGWLEKHVRVVEGRPVARNPKVQVWVMTMAFRALAGGRVLLQMALSNEEPLLPVRCFQLSGGEADDLSELVGGYEHVLEEETEIQVSCLISVGWQFL